jgi:plastocyanin
MAYDFTHPRHGGLSHATLDQEVRFTLKAGMHNVHFLPDSNPGKGALPAASDLLQMPGQTYDVKVVFEPGTYYFQCDPHALLGMKGHVKIEGD